MEVLSCGVALKQEVPLGLGDGLLDRRRVLTRRHVRVDLGGDPVAEHGDAVVAELKEGDAAAGAVPGEVGRVVVVVAVEDDAPEGRLKRVVRRSLPVLLGLDAARLVAPEGGAPRLGVHGRRLGRRRPVAALHPRRWRELVACVPHLGRPPVPVGPYVCLDLVDGRAGLKRLVPPRPVVPHDDSLIRVRARHRVLEVAARLDASLGLARAAPSAGVEVVGEAVPRRPGLAARRVEPVVGVLADVAHVVAVVLEHHERRGNVDDALVRFSLDRTPHGSRDHQGLAHARVGVLRHAGRGALDVLRLRPQLLFMVTDGAKREEER